MEGDYRVESVVVVDRQAGGEVGMKNGDYTWGH